MAKPNSRRLRKKWRAKQRKAEIRKARALIEHGHDHIPMLQGTSMADFVSTQQAIAAAIAATKESVLMQVLGKYEGVKFITSDKLPTIKFRRPPWPMPASDREQYADARTEIEKMCRDEALAASMERERDER